MSESIQRDLRQRYATNIFLSSLLGSLFSAGTFYFYPEKENIMVEVQEGGELLYYGMMCGLVGLSGFFLYSLIKDIYIYMNIKHEKIVPVEADLNDIKFKITSNQTLQPYLRVKDYNIAPIIGITDEKEVFDEGVKYRFYFTSRSRIFLAVEEIK